MRPIDFVARASLYVRRRLGRDPGSRIKGFTGDISEVSRREQQQTDLHRMFYGNTGPVVHKWRHYLEIYHRYLSRYRGTPVRMLEIGVFRGGSMKLWREYLGPKAVIYGIDVDKTCSRFDGQYGRVRIGSQDDTAFLRDVVAEMGGVDVVIDDGSHVSSHQITSFNGLFGLLDPHGIYICEDVHSNYWPGWYEGGYGRGDTFIGLTKTLIDDMHADFHNRRSAIISDAHRSIGAIHIHNSMIVIEKCPQIRPSHVMVGSITAT
jgi:hypothetical protein